MSKMMYNRSPKQKLDKIIIYIYCYRIRVITNIKIIGNVSNYPFSLRNANNYPFRSSFNIGNIPPMNRKSVGTKTFSNIIHNS
jgi:hypothetical protein